MLIALLEPMAFSMLKAKHMLKYSAKTKAYKFVVWIAKRSFLSQTTFSCMSSALVMPPRFPMHSRVHSAFIGAQMVLLSLASKDHLKQTWLSASYPVLILGIATVKIIINSDLIWKPFLTHTQNLAI